MQVDSAIALLTNHRNGDSRPSYEEQKEAQRAIRHLVTTWVQQVDGYWQLVIVGYMD